MMNEIRYEAMQESANYGACFAAFHQAHPKEPLSNAEECDGGSWSCQNCPWKMSSPLHSGNPANKNG